MQKDLSNYNGPGVYIFYSEKEVFYVGESSNLANRIKKHYSRSRVSTLRRTIAEMIGIEIIKTATGKKVASIDEHKITEWIEQHLMIDFEPKQSKQEALNREIELIHKYHPLLNKKFNN